MVLMQVVEALYIAYSCSLFLLVPKFLSYILLFDLKDNTNLFDYNVPLRVDEFVTAAKTQVRCRGSYFSVVRESVEITSVPSK